MALEKKEEEDALSPRRRSAFMPSPVAHPREPSSADPAHSRAAFPLRQVVRGRSDNPATHDPYMVEVGAVQKICSTGRLPRIKHIAGGTTPPANCTDPTIQMTMTA